MKNPSKTRLMQDIIIYGTIGIVLLFIAYLAINGIIKSSNPVTTGAIHWHAQLTYETCGETIKPEEIENHGSIIHGHNDGLIHIEGTVLSDTDITLQKYIESTGVDLNEYKCEGTESTGKVKYFVNDVEYSDPSQIVVADGQKVRISIE